MKRYLSVFLAVLLTAAFSCGALADYDPATAAFTAYDTGSSDVEFNPAAGTYADYVQLNGQQGFAIFGSDGTLLSDACYPTMQYCGSDEPYYVVASEGDDVANRWGLVDGYTGQLSVPTQYFTIAYLSDRWQVGVVVTEGSESSYDFRASQDDGYVYYSADHFDVYYGGALVGTLERDAVDAGDPSYSANAYGDYLYVEDREGKLRCFDKTLTASAYPSEFGESSYSEYTWEGVHKGSNQQAFAPDCTLTPDEVGNPYLTDGGILYDLQGNMVLRAPSGIYLREYEPGNAYIAASFDDKVGVLSLATGEEVVPFEYDELLTFEGELFHDGYQFLVKDGKVGAVNEQGEVTCPFTYSEDSVDSSLYSPAPVRVVKDSDGSMIVLSAAVGELPTRYADATVSYDSDAPYVVVEDAEGQVGVIDMYGNTIIPFSADQSVYGVEISADGSVVCVCNDDSYTYTLYTLQQSEAAPAADNAVSSAQESDEAQALMPESLALEALTSEAETPEAESTADDATWTCACGQEGNTGSFCPACGAARPLTACPNCGYAPADGALPNFCPECGTALQ